MNKWNRFAFVAVTAVAVSALPGAASAEVGKKISVAPVGSGVVAASPVFTSAGSLAVPTSYKSKSNVLKVTTSYQATCGSGDTLRSKVTVGGVDMVDAGLPVDAFDEDVSYQMVTKTYHLVPEKQGGPAVPKASTVTLQLTSELGTGCSISSGTMIVEALK